MTKQDLLHDLHSPSSTLSVLQKGYLFTIPLDEEIYLALVSKLTKEAKEAGDTLETLDNHNTEAELEAALGKLDEINRVVFSTISSQLHKEPYIAHSIQKVQKYVTSKKVAQLQGYYTQGYSFLQDPLTGDFKILNLTNSLVAVYPYKSAKELLQLMGVDTSDAMYYLFYAAIFPREDLNLFRALATFDLHFQFN
jgi:hypothetical protein